MPSCTVDGAFGMARTTGISPCNRRSIADVGIAAASESTVCVPSSAGAISSRRAFRSCGLTAITTTAAPRTASVFDVPTSIP